MLRRACLIVGTSVFVVMLDEQHRHSPPVASGLSPGLAVLECHAEKLRHKHCKNVFCSS